MRLDHCCHLQTNKLAPYGSLLALAWCVAFAEELLAEPPAAPAPMARVERAILAEDWKEVLRVLEDVTSASPDPVSRLVKGHACLALNENNESVCLFLSVQTPEDRKRWLEWVRDFAKRHSAVAIAHYYHGDALARLAQWDDAVGCFTSAINQAPGKQHALAFNARGVVYASRKEFRKARVDFDSALTASTRRLADAYANVGALRIDSKEAAEAALRAFDGALAAELSPKYALALHGRACVELVLGKNEKAKTDFQRAEEYGGCAVPMLERNRVRIVAYWRGMTENELLAAIQSGADAGTTLDSRLTATKNALQDYFGHPGSQSAFNNFISHYGHLTPAQQQSVDQTIKSALASNPALASAFRNNNSAVLETNKPNGLAPFFGAVLGTVPFTGGLGNYVNNWAHANDRNATHFQDLTRPNTAGGLDMDLTRIAWEGGKWPFLAYYGLIFDNTVSDIPYVRLTTTR